MQKIVLELRDEAVLRIERFLNGKISRMGNQNVNVQINQQSLAKYSELVKFLNKWDKIKFENVKKNYVNTVQNKYRKIFSGFLDKIKIEKTEKLKLNFANRFSDFSAKERIKILGPFKTISSSRFIMKKDKYLIEEFFANINGLLLDLSLSEYNFIEKFFSVAELYSDIFKDIFDDIKKFFDRKIKLFDIFGVIICVRLNQQNLKWSENLKHLENFYWSLNDLLWPNVKNMFEEFVENSAEMFPRNEREAVSISTQLKMFIESVGALNEEHEDHILELWSEKLIDKTMVNWLNSNDENSKIAAIICSDKFINQINNQNDKIVIKLGKEIDSSLMRKSEIDLEKFKLFKEMDEKYGEFEKRALKSDQTKSAQTIKFLQKCVQNFSKEWQIFITTNHKNIEEQFSNSQALQNRAKSVLIRKLLKKYAKIEEIASHLKFDDISSLTKIKNECSKVE
ncbi:hypothetical protein MHBO_000490 [Bonamia ostreae]